MSEREIAMSEFKKILMYPHKLVALKYFIHNPLSILLFLKMTSRFYFSRILRNCLSLNKKDFSYIPYSIPKRFSAHLVEKDFCDDYNYYLLLYSIIRRYNPDIVVETGVSIGVSTAYILAAMHENNKGTLYSIDLQPWIIAKIKEIDTQGNIDIILEDRQKYRLNKSEINEFIGSFVPEYLKERWTLIIGDSKELLPLLLRRLGKISIFLHDSLHTYEHMRFEFETAWPYLTDYGILLSHDILWNNAFVEFSKKVTRRPLIYYNFGIIKK